jgi:hypothetical protein
MENLPSELPSYHITLNSQSDALVCELEHLGVIFHTDIKETDLKSGLVSLAKLKNIIQSNSKNTQPNFIIKLNGIFNELTHQNNLVLNIKFDSDFIDFEENIYFREKNDIIEDCNQIKKLNEIIVEQGNKIKYLENKLEQIMTSQIDKIEDEQFITVYALDNNCQSKVFGRDAKPRILRKNISCVFTDIGVTIRNISDSKIPLYFPNIDIVRNQIDNFCNVKEFGLFLQNDKGFDEKYNANMKKFLQFLDSQLQNGKIVLSICLDFFDNDCEFPKFFNILKKYTNYKKLTISFSNNLNDLGIKQHCKLNNIEYNLWNGNVLIEN